MVRVERKDYKEQTFKRYGKIQTTIPAHYICRYYHKPTIQREKEIAMYDSREAVLRLRTEYIARDRKLSTYQRALQGEYSDAYRHLFEMLGVDETTQLSEYMNA